jgi:putative endonuclease
MPDADVSERLFRLKTGSHCMVVQKPVQEEHYVYMACCANGALYTGYTTHVKQRIAAHNAGVGGRYTRSNRPIVLLAVWRFNSRAEALHAERSIKRLSHDRKLALAESAALAQGERL